MVNAWARAELEATLAEVQRAGVEGAEGWLVESCPACSEPQIVQDPAAAVLLCPAAPCGRETCRGCLGPSHLGAACEELLVTRVRPSRRFDESDPLSMGFRVAEGQVLRLQARGVHTDLAIHSVDIVSNKRLKEKFDVKKAELARAGCGEGVLLFHGTAQGNIEGIMRDNFDLRIISNGRAHGNGVYFSERPEVSLGYNRPGARIQLGAKRKRAE